MVFIVYNDLISYISVHLEVKMDLRGCYCVSMVGSSEQDVFLVFFILTSLYFNSNLLLFLSKNICSVQHLDWK